MFSLTHPHQDPGSAVLYVLELFEALARDPDEECVAIVQPGGDEGVDKFFGVGNGECGAEFGDIPQVVE